MFQNNEIMTLISAIGAGVSEDFNIEKVRYTKIFIMVDADVDGAHIACLLLTFFFRYMRPLIEAGYLYRAQPPLYKLQKGKEIHYVFQEKEKDQLLEHLGEGVTIQRYKGLGEMNPEQLWETTLNKEHRKIIQVTINDGAEADQTFSILMGEDVAPRKEFIQEHAKYVKNLDV